MRKFIYNRKGHTSIFVCLSMPIIIAILGICIDGGIMVFYKVKLMTATKFSAISATSFYNLEDGHIIIDNERALIAAEGALKENFNEAVLKSFAVGEDKKNECTVETEVKVPRYFTNIFEVFGVEVKDKMISESYTVERNSNE